MVDKKLYYTDPLAAAYMAREFGVRFFDGTKDDELKAIRYDNCIKWAYSSGIFPDGERVDSFSFYKGERFYIHPDSLSIFEPKVEDLMTEGKTIVEHVYKTIDKQVMSRGHLFYSPYKIIQRNNKPFFMPEEE